MPQVEYPNWDMGIMEYWNDGVTGGNPRNPSFPILMPTIPKIHHSNSLKIALRDNGFPKRSGNSRVPTFDNVG